MTRLAGRAAQLMRVLRTLRRARDEGTISAEQYEAAVEAIDPAPDRPREPEPGVSLLWSASSCSSPTP